MQSDKITYSILGAGGLGRELYTWMNQEAKYIDFAVDFFDDNPEVLSNHPSIGKVNGKINEVSPNSPNLLLAIANPKFRELVYNLFSHSQFISYLSNRAVLAAVDSIPRGTIVFPLSVISCNVKLGFGIFINCGSQIGHDATIGNFCSIMANVDIGGGSQIGNRVFIGSGATILPGVRVCDDVLIGAGSVVIKSIRKPGTYFGNPAVKII